MKDLESSPLIWLKGVLFALIGVSAAGLLIAELPTLKVAILLAAAIWGFCRAYYFAFYVIEHYVDPTYRFSERVLKPRLGRGHQVWSPAFRLMPFGNSADLALDSRAQPHRDLD